MRVLALGMFVMMGANGIIELSYESRVVHHIAALGHEVDYWTDKPMDYSMEPILRKPPTLRNFLFHEGVSAIAHTPRQFHPLDVKKIIYEHNNHPPYSYGDDPKPLKPYDLVFASATTGIDMGQWIKQLLGIPLVVQWLDIPYWRINPFLNDEIYAHKAPYLHLPLLPPDQFKAFQNEWGWWFSNLGLIDRICTIGNVVKRQILEYASKFGIQSDKIPPIDTVFHGSLDQQTVDAVFARYPAPEKKNQVLICSRIDFHKGVDQGVLICKLIQDLMPDNPPSFVIISTGGQDWYIDLITKAAKAWLKNVTFTGWISNADKFKLFRESKVLLYNEWPEGFMGMALSEALYSDCVPLTWDTESKREVNPIGPIRIKMDDYEAMAKAAVEVLRRPYQPVSEEVKQYIREKRSVASHAQGLVESFERALKK